MAIEAYVATTWDSEVWYYWRNANSGHRVPENYQYFDVDRKKGFELGVPFGKVRTLSNDERPIDGFADWLTGSENRRFTQTIVNRLWTVVFGRTLTGSLTDVSEIQDSDDPELVDFLMRLMVDLDYDQRKFLEVLLSTRAYQRQSSVDASASDVFQSPIVRRMTAEQVWDSFMTLICVDVDAGVFDLPDTSAYDEYAQASTVEEFWEVVNRAVDEDRDYRKRFAAVQKKRREIKQAGGFHPDELKRASELKAPAEAGHFLMEFGQSDRELIDNHWTTGTVPQVLTLLNGPLFERIVAVDSPVMRRVNETKLHREKVRIAYLSVLGREPTFDEIDLMVSACEQRGIERIVWTLLNTTEFLFVH